MSKSQEDKIRAINRVYTSRDAIPWIIGFSLFFIAGSLFAETIAPLFFIPLPILLSLLVIRILNNIPDKADRIAEVLYGKVLDSCFKEGFAETECPLTPDDIRKLESLVSYGYHFKSTLIKALIGQNKKVIIRGYVTSKNWIDNEQYWILAKTHRIEIPDGLYYSSTIGDFVEMEVAKNVVEWISVYKPNFILRCDILVPASKLLDL